MLTETAAPVVDQALIDELADHLKLASGFGTDAEDELEGSLRGAVAHLEARLGLALIQRNFVWRVSLPSDGVVTSAIGPVSAIISVDRILSGGGVEPQDLAQWSLDQGRLRTRFCGPSNTRDQFDISFTAGFGALWADTPSDLRRAALMLAAHFFENRYASAAGLELLPLGVKELIAPWRRIRVGFGGV